MRIARHVQSQQALGGTATIGLIGSWTTPEIERLFATLWRHVFQFEKQFSRFLPSSELSNVNRHAGIMTHISPGMYALLKRSLAASTTTKELYNPFVLPAVQRSGYLHSVVESYQNDTVPDYRTRRVAKPAEMQLTATSVQIPFSTALDLGGIGKGYLADQLADIVDQNNPRGYWIDLSGDIALFGVDEHSEPLSVAIQNSEQIITTDGVRCGIATSGTKRRHANGTHHIIDPRTGQSTVTDLHLATVIASDATTADTLASIALIVGEKAAPGLLSAHSVHGWVLQSENGTISSTASSNTTIGEPAYAS